MRSSLDMPSPYYPPDIPEQDQSGQFPSSAPPDLQETTTDFTPPPVALREDFILMREDELDSTPMRPPELRDKDSEPSDLPEPEASPPSVEQPEDNTPAEKEPAQPPGGGKPPGLPPPTGGDEGNDTPEEGKDENVERPVAKPELPEGADAQPLDKERTQPLITEAHTSVTGPFEVTTGMVQEADTRFFRTPEGRLSFDGQVEMTGERRQEVQKYQGAVQKVAEEAGVDISDRFLSLEEHHFFTSKSELHAALRETGEDPLPGHEGQWNKYGLFLLDKGDDVDTGYKILHETGHSVARRGIEGVLTPESDVEAGVPPVTIAKAHNGYREYSVQGGQQSHKKAAIDEMVTDLVTVHGTTKYTDIERITAGYGALVVAGYELIQGAADLHGEQPMDILLQLERGHFIGDDTGLQKIAAYLGEDKFGLLATAPPTPELVRGLDMPEIVEKMNAVAAGADFRPPWLLHT